MLVRFWRWLVGTGYTRDGYYYRVEHVDAGNVEVGVKTWEELVAVMGGRTRTDRNDREAERRRWEGYGAEVRRRLDEVKRNAR